MILSQCKKKKEKKEIQNNLQLLAERMLLSGTYDG
jgi:hypothetical protein